ncbi:response regulator [Rhodobacterales bacterium HKCCE2091]|nr:response regulator [Rhodobacterales bacterium HKCCE2091]
MASARFTDRLAMERRARLAAERLLAQRSEELYAANRKLSEHARTLSEQVIQAREVNAALQGQTSRAKAETAAANEKATRAERRLWDSLHSIPDLYAVFDQDHRMVLANQAYLGIFEGIADVAPGASYETVLRICVEEGIVNTGDLAGPDWIDMMLSRWESDEIPETVIELYDGSFVRFVDRRTEYGDVLSLGINITETIRQERELREARDAAEAASRAKSAFLANMSHEIRTPMNGVVGMADLLSDTPLDEEQREYVDTIRNSGEALLEIINDVLDYSKIEADKLALRSEPFDLEQAILDVFRLLSPAMREKGLGHELDYDIFLPDRMIGDPGRIRQILTNLMGNAVKFTDAGYIKVMVTHDSVTDDGVALRIVVEDTGIGIPPDMAEAIFADFTQVEEQKNRQYEGTGLGLAITQRLVGMMGGSIWVDSELGRGSAFGITLQLGVPEGMALDPVPPLPKGLRRVVMVDRGEGAGKGLDRALRKLAAQVLPLEHAGEAGLAILVLGPGGEPHAPDLAALVAEGYSGTVVLAAEGGAEVDIEMPEGLAATSLSLPQKLADLRDALADIPPGTPSARPSGGAKDRDGTAPRRLQLLAAEDNKTNQLVFKMMLKTLDLDLRLANDGEELVAAYLAERPDLLFTDISMPGVDGLEAARRIRDLEARKGLDPVPMVAMTAHASDEEQERIRDAGIEHYLSKPLRKDAIVSTIRQLAPGDCDLG